MGTITDAELFAHAERAKGKVVLITGGGNGIGRCTALDFARRGAKVVIGDISEKAATEVVEEVVRANGEAVWQKCDVTVWEEQHALFKFAVKTYGSVDIVVANAGITESGRLIGGPTLADGEPKKPQFPTVDVNLIGVLYTTQLAIHYFGTKHQPWEKSLVLLGSMASLVGIPGAPLYTLSKHALLGLMRSLYQPLDASGIRIAVISPWFVDTRILGTPTRLILAGIPKAKVERVSGAILRAATDPSPDTNGCVWTIPDGEEVFLLDRAQLNEGVYKAFYDRIKRGYVAVGWIKGTAKTMSELFDILGTKLLLFAVGVALGAAVWQKFT